MDYFLSLKSVKTFLSNPANKHDQKHNPFGAGDY